jgi:predicted nucleic acid-binding protein
MKYNYVLDSYAWAEFFNGTEKGEKVKKIIEEGNIATSIITLAEFSDKCAREERDITPIVEYIQSKAAILSLNQETALNAGKLKYELRKISKNISLADSIHLQTAKSVNAIFVTGDQDFKDIKNIFFL